MTIEVYILPFLLLSFFIYKAVKNCPSKIRGSKDSFQIQCLSPRSWNIRVFGRKRIYKFLLNYHYYNVRTFFFVFVQIDLLLLQDKRLSRCYGYSPVGARATVKRQAQNWGPRISAIPIICMEGIIEVGIYQGNVDGARFEEFVNQKLCPNLRPFNGVSPRSMVIMGKVKLFATST